jgi:hypothetical protein
MQQRQANRNNMRTTPTSRPAAVPAALLLPVWIAIGIVPFAAKPASAGESVKKTAVVLEPKVTGPIIPQDLTLIQQTVQKALEEQNFQVASKEEREGIENAGNLKNCYRNDCLEQLGRLLGGNLVLAYKIKVEIVELPAPPPAQVQTQAPEPKKGRHSAPPPPSPVQQTEPAPAQENVSPLNWEVSANLYDIEVGAIGARVETKCEHCSGPQVAQSTAELIKRAVFEDASKARGQIEILSTPSNASVLFDGVELGVTPYKRQTFIGKHEITVRHTGHKSHNQDINVSETEKLSLNLELEVGRDPIKYIQEYQPRPKWRLGLGGAMIGLGLVGIGFGAYGLAINGKCIDTPVPPALTCMSVYQGLPAGLGFTVGGIVVAAAGAVIIALPGKRNSLAPENGPDTFGDKDKPADAPPPRHAALSIGGLGSGYGLGLVGTY